MGTCVGLELTGSNGSLNHQNAFPFILKPRTQDNGAPDTHIDPEVQISRIALWDNRAQKLIQTNHPDALLLKASESGIENQVAAQLAELESGTYDAVLIDPLGNLMMVVPLDLDPRLLLKDLKKLLKLSRIG